MRKHCKTCKHCHLNGPEKCEIARAIRRDPTLTQGKWSLVFTLKASEWRSA